MSVDHAMASSASRTRRIDAAKAATAMKQASGTSIANRMWPVASETR